MCISAACVDAALTVAGRLCQPANNTVPPVDLCSGFWLNSMPSQACLPCWTIETIDPSGLAPHPFACQVITVNQVVDIMSRLLVNPDWKTVLDVVLPGRKRAEPGGGQRVTADGGTGGSSSKEQSPAPPAAAEDSTDEPQAQAVEAAAASTAAGSDANATALTAAAPDAAAAGTQCAVNRH